MPDLMGTDPRAFSDQLDTGSSKKMRSITKI